MSGEKTIFGQSENAYERTKIYSFRDDILHIDASEYDKFSGENGKKLLSISLMSEMACSVLDMQNIAPVKLVKNGDAVAGINIRDLVMLDAADAQKNADSYATGVYIANVIADKDEVFYLKIKEIESMKENIRITGDRTELLSKPDSYFDLMFPGVHIDTDLNAKITDDMFAHINAEKLTKPQSGEHYIQFDQSQSLPYPGYIRVTGPDGRVGFVRIHREPGVTFNDQINREFYLMSPLGEKINIISDGGIFRLNRK